MKKILIAITSLTLSLVTAFGLTACNLEKEESKATSYVSVDINPSIELTLDQNDKVMSVVGANEDGQVLLYGEASLIGEDVEDAVEKITQLAIELGYLSEENKVVETNVTSKDEDKGEKILEKINAKITVEGEKFGVKVTTSGKGAYTLMRKYEQFIAEHPEIEGINDLTFAEFKLAVSASETGEVSLEVAVTLDKEELLEIVSTAHKQIKDYCTAEYKKAQAQAKIAYEKAMSEVLDVIYIKYDVINGSRYNAYKMISRVADGLAEAVKLTSDVRNYELTEEEVGYVLTALNLTAEEVEKIQDSNGKVTVASVYAYVDKYVKNLTEEEVVLVKEKIDLMLDEIDVAVGEKVQSALIAHQEELQELAQTVNGIIDAIDDKIGLIIPEEVQQIIDLAVTEFTAIIDEIALMCEDGLTYEELKEFANKNKAKADEILAQIKAELTEDEQKQIENLKAFASLELLDDRKEFEDQINLKVEDAKAHLSAQKEQRRR